MPNYNTASPVPISAIYPGDVQTLWNAESPTIGTASVQVAISQNLTGGEFDISATIRFSGAPGAFEVDLQTADLDADGNYVTVAGAAMTIVNPSPSFAANYQAHVRANFARLFMKTVPANPVTITAIIGR